MIYSTIFGIVLISPIVDNFVSFYDFKFWMLASTLSLLYLTVFSVLLLRIPKIFSSILLANIILSIIFYLDELNFEFNRFLLFFLSFSVFFVIRDLVKNDLYRFWRLERNFFYVIAFFAFAQVLFALSGYSNDIFRGREYFGFRQVTSFFAEPAFFAVYLNWHLYMHLFIHKDFSRTNIVITYALIFLTFSLTGWASALVLTCLYFFSSLQTGKLVSFRRVFALMAGLAIGIFLALEMEFFDIILRRFDGEILDAIHLLFNDPKEGVLAGSGTLRVIGEMQYLFFVLRESPILGLGLSYDETEFFRINTLNAITEIGFRWGLVGIICFTFLIMPFIRTYKLSAIIFLGLFLFSDGAIAKPEFWLYLGVLVGLTTSTKSIVQNTMSPVTQRI